MASRIQGITVEISGDTTKLSKALEGVNKSIKGTQSGLKDVNKLLKIDPTNTELVVQKQKMLKDAIEAQLLPKLMRQERNFRTLEHRSKMWVRSSCL